MVADFFYWHKFNLHGVVFVQQLYTACGFDRKERARVTQHVQHALVLPDEDHPDALGAVRHGNADRHAEFGMLHFLAHVFSFVYLNDAAAGHRDKLAPKSKVELAGGGHE